MTCIKYLEQCGALKDVYMTALQYGDIAKVYIRNEGDVSRDLYEDMKYGKIETDVTAIEIPAFPATFQPNRKVVEKAGLKEDCECLIATPMYSWNLAEVDFEEIDITRSTVILRGIKYVIKEKALSDQFIDTFLYIMLGLKRK